MRLLRGRRYNRLKRSRETNLKQNQPIGQIVPSVPERTAERLASEHGVTERTIRRDGKFAEEVARTPELQEAVSSFSLDV
jgi:hypothetical protein